VNRANRGSVNHGLEAQPTSGVLSCTSSYPDDDIRSSGESSGRSSGSQTRSIRSTVTSAGLLIGRTHLSVAARSLVGEDPGVPMSHINVIDPMGYDM
jgi:hypothetical protein